MHDTLFLRVVNQLELKGQECLLESLLIVVRDQKLALPSKLLEYDFDVISILIHQLMRFLKPNALNGVQIVAATQDAASQQHILSERPEVQFFHFSQPIEVNFYPIPILIHLKHHFAHSEYQQV